MKKKVPSDFVFLQLDIYEAIMKEVAEYKKLQKEKGVKWVKVKLGNKDQETAKESDEQRTNV